MVASVGNLWVWSWISRGFENFKTLWWCNRTRFACHAILILVPIYLWYVLSVLIVKTGCCQSSEVLGIFPEVPGSGPEPRGSGFFLEVLGSGHNQSLNLICFVICITFTCYTFLCTPRWVEYIAVATHAHNVCLHILKGYSLSIQRRKAYIKGELRIQVTKSSIFSIKCKL
jgi:hypothetical protein